MGWRAFPSRRKARIWVSEGDKGKNVSHLYSPYSTLGSFAKWVLLAAPLALWRKGEPESCKWIEDIQNTVKRVLGSDDLFINVSIGTPGPHQKHTVQVFDEGRILAYVKVATTAGAREQLEYENTALTSYSANISSALSVPKVSHYEVAGELAYLFLSAPDDAGEVSPLKITHEDIYFLERLLQQKSQSISVLSAVKSALPQSLLSSIELAGKGTDLLGRVINTVTRLAAGKEVRTGPAQGDFVPWNTRHLHNGSLYVFDWEYFDSQAPLLLDLFHRSFMPAKLVLRKSPAKACHGLLELWDTPLTRDYLDKADVSKDDGVLYVLLYLLKLVGRAVVDGRITDHYLLDSIRYVLALPGVSGMRLRVLVSAYACEPDKGSEPGVGWNWVKQIAVYNDVWLLTRNNNSQSIERELETGRYKNIHPVYVDPPRYLTFWKRQQRGVRAYYYIWQFAAWREARRLHRNLHFDIGHHVSFVNDWIWTFFALMPIPYVWGPIGSHPKSPAQLLPSSASRRMDFLRYAFQTFMRVADPLYWLSAWRASRIVVINGQLADNIPLRWLGRSKFVVEPAIGIDEMELPEHSPSTTIRTYLFVGRLEPVKSPHLALQAFGRLCKDTDVDIRFTMVGEGSEKRRLEQIARDLGVESRVEFIDWLARSEVLRYFRDADVFLFPSMEGGGMVVLEAMMLGLPVVCLNYGGPGEMVDSGSGCKVEVGDADTVITELASCMRQLLDPEKVRQSGAVARKRPWRPTHGPEKRPLPVPCMSNCSPPEPN